MTYHGTTTATVLSTVGMKLTIYMAEAESPEQVKRWAACTEEVPDPCALRLAVAACVLRFRPAFISEAEMVAWFQGMNPQLDDTAPATAVRDGDWVGVSRALDALLSGQEMGQ